MPANEYCSSPNKSFAINWDSLSETLWKRFKGSKIRNQNGQVRGWKESLSVFCSEKFVNLQTSLDSNF